MAGQLRGDPELPAQGVGDLRDVSDEVAAEADIEPLALTGERTVPGVWHENYWFRRHEAAYEYALGLVHGRRVVEVGCGEGYGTALLGGGADVLGLDYDETAVAHAARTYPAARFVRANLAALPIADRSCDAVVTLQVIEHVWDHPQFVRECRRVVRPGGLLLVTTPNRLTFSPGLDAPVNPFHTVEFTAAELRALLEAHGFRVDRIAGLHAGARLHALDDAHGGSFVDAQLAAVPDQWGSELRRDVESVAAADFVVLADAERDVDRSLDLVVLAHPD